MNKIIIIILASALLTKANAQCKTFKISSKGDTLNCTDNKNKKQGKWINRYQEFRGEPGFEEEGEYKDNLKEGKWRVYSLDGDLIAVENYRWGLKDGQQVYLEKGELEHEESWRAPNPDNEYDTIQVPDVFDPDKYEMKIVKAEKYSKKHGVWKWYRLGSQTIIRTEMYLFNELQIPTAVATKPSRQDSLRNAAKSQKPKAVQEFEKKNSGKKKVKYQDGSLGF